MYFKLEYTIQSMTLGPEEGDSLHFQYDDAHQIVVSLRNPTEDEQKQGHNKENAFCIAVSQQEPSPPIRAMFESLANNRLPEESVKMHDLPHSNYIDKQGNIEESHVAPFSLLPGQLQSFILQVRRELSDYMRRTVHTIRWRCQMSGPHNPFLGKSMVWSFDNQHWKRMPTPTGLRIIFRQLIIPPSDMWYDDAMRLLNEGVTPPLCHELFREAWEQQEENPRSALVIGMTAAEVGFKELVCNLTPEARWIIENTPSPPLIKMLEEYLPKLPAKCKIRGKVLPPPTELIEVLKKGVALRNKVSHIGTASLREETILEVLEAVRDLLWILDYYCGFEWALDYVRVKTRNELETESR